MSEPDRFIHPESLIPLVNELRSGKLNLSAYIERALARIAEAEPRIQALLPEEGRPERLKSEATTLESRFPDPAGRPPLFGVLVGIKDIFATDGFETRAGSRLPPELFRMKEGPLVAALKRAGALVLGKTVTTEFAFFAPGPTANPWNPAHTPGGSSSGSAAAVAAGYCSLATGTQTIGSISRPAAFCGIAGWKPSYERTSRAGIVPFSPSVDHAGLFAADAAGLALAAPLVIPDWNVRAFTTARDGLAVRPLVALVPDGQYLEQTTPAARAVFERQIESLAGSGVEIRRIMALPDIAAINARHRRICAADLARVHRSWFAEYEELYSTTTADLIHKGLMISDEELERDKRGCLMLRSELDRALQGADFWLSPAAPGPALAGLSSTGDPVMNLPWTHAGVPTIAIPDGLSDDGLPLGLQLAGPFGHDEKLLAISMVTEKLLAEANA